MNLKWYVINNNILVFYLEGNNILLVLDVAENGI